MFSNFSKDGNIKWAIDSFRLVKLKSTNKSELSLICVIEIFESWVGLKNFNVWQTGFRIKTSNSLIAMILG